MGVINLSPNLGRLLFPFTGMLLVVCGCAKTVYPDGHKSDVDDQGYVTSIQRASATDENYDDFLVVEASTASRTRRAHKRPGLVHVQSMGGRSFSSGLLVKGLRPVVDHGSDEYSRGVTYAQASGQTSAELSVEHQAGISDARTGIRFDFAPAMMPKAVQAPVVHANQPDLYIEATSSTSATPTLPAGPKLDTAVVDNVLKRLALGKVSYNWPDKIPTHGWTTIALAIGVHASGEDLEKLLNTVKARRPSVRGVILSDDAKLASTMQASLIGADFEIQPSGPVRKSLASTEPTVWEWQVKPRVSGDLLLTLRLEAVLQINQTESPWTIQTWEKNITVETSVWETIKDFLNETILKPETLWTVVIVPCLAFLGAFLRRWWSRQKR